MLAVRISAPFGTGAVNPNPCHAKHSGISHSNPGNNMSTTTNIGCIKEIPFLTSQDTGFLGQRVMDIGTEAPEAQGVDITIPVTCSVFEPDPMTSQCTRGVPRLKFRHKIDEMWVIFSFVALTSLKFHRRVAKHHCCVKSHGAILGPDDVTGQGDLAGWPYLYYRALPEAKVSPRRRSN